MVAVLLIIHQFSLFGLKKDKKIEDKVVINAFACDAANEIKVKDGKYTEDLNVKIALAVKNATKLQNSDIVIKYSYLNKNREGLGLTVSGASLQTNEPQTNEGSSK